MMYEYCKSCVHDMGDIGFCDKCGYTYMLRKRGLPPTEYEAELKPQTNADRIRAMTDEELVSLFTQMQYDGVDCFCCPVPGDCYGKICRQCFLDWLKQEVKE